MIEMGELMTYVDALEEDQAMEEYMVRAVKLSLSLTIYACLCVCVCVCVCVCCRKFWRWMYNHMYSLLVSSATGPKTDMSTF